MYAPGVVGIAVGLLILLIMRDSPESIGYPPIEPKKPSPGGLDFDSVTSSCQKQHAWHILTAWCQKTHSV